MPCSASCRFLTMRNSRGSATFRPREFEFVGQVLLERLPHQRRDGCAMRLENIPDKHAEQLVDRQTLLSSALEHRFVADAGVAGLDARDKRAGHELPRTVTTHERHARARLLGLEVEERTA